MILNSQLIMSIQYKFRKLPPTADANGAVAPRLYPIAVKTRTIRFDEMAADVSEACSFSPADLKGIIQAIADVTARYLNDGCHIEFEHFHSHMPITNNRYFHNKSKSNLPKLLFNHY